MPSRKPAKTPRRLLKLASLGLAGLIAGLLSGCSSTPNYTLASYSQSSGWHFDSASSSAFHPRRLDTHPVPDFKRAPIPHRTESWAFRTPPQPTFSGREPARTLTNYDFTAGHYSVSSGVAQLSVQ